MPRHSAASRRRHAEQNARAAFWGNRVLLRLLPVMARVRDDVLHGLRNSWSLRHGGTLSRGEADRIVPERADLVRDVFDAILPTFWQAYWSEGTLRMEAFRLALGRGPTAPVLTEEHDGDALVSDGRGNLVLFGGATNLHVDYWDEMPTVLYRTDLRAAQAAAYELCARRVAEAQQRGGMVTQRVDARLAQWRAEGHLSHSVRPAVFVLRLPREQLDDLTHEAPGVWRYRGRRRHYGVAYDLLERDSEQAWLRVWQELYVPLESRAASTTPHNRARTALPGVSGQESGTYPNRGKTLLAGLLRAKGRIEVPVPVEPFRNFPGDPVAARNMVGHEFAFSGKVADNLRARLTGEFIAGIGKGENMAKLQARVVSVFQGADPMRSSAIGAERIARTESQRALVTAQMGAYRQLGMEGLLKGWLDSGDDRVRPSHQDAGFRYMNNPIPMEELFIVGGSPMMHPLDPAGRAEEIIRCRCSMEAFPPGRADLPAGFKLEAYMEGELVVSDVGPTPGLPEESLRSRWKKADVDGRKELIRETMLRGLPKEVKDAEVEVQHAEGEWGSATMFRVVGRGVAAERVINAYGTGPIEATNRSVTVAEELQRLKPVGVATSIYRATERVYDALNVRIVRTRANGTGVRVWTREKFGNRVTEFQTQVAGELDSWLTERGWSNARRTTYIASLVEQSRAPLGLQAATIDRGFWESGRILSVDLHRDRTTDELGF